MFQTTTAERNAVDSAVIPKVELPFLNKNDKKHGEPMMGATDGQTCGSCAWTCAWTCDSTCCWHCSKSNDKSPPSP